LPNDLPSYKTKETLGSYQVTIRDIVEFTSATYGINPSVIQIYPNFLILDYVKDNERYDKPLISEFKGVVSQIQKYCIAYVITGNKIDEIIALTKFT